MKPLLPLLALLAACPMPDEPEDKSEGTVDDTDTDLPADTERDDTGAGEDDPWWGGHCEYTGVAVGADEEVEALGGTPSEWAALVSGTRNTTFHWDETDTDTTLDHTLTIDATTATLWTGVWVEGHGDTGWVGTDTGMVLDDDTDVDVGDTAGSSGSSSGSEGEDDPGDTGATGTDSDVDTGAVDVDVDDTGVTDTDVGEACPAYVTAEADWSFATGDGAFAEDLRVLAHATGPDVARIDHELDYFTLSGAWVPAGMVPSEWEEIRVQWAANIGVEADNGEVALYASRVFDDGDTGTADVGEAMIGDVGRWPSPER